MKKEIIKFVILLMVAAGGGPAGAAIWQWSTTASTNATADPSINFAEGMAPSAVNDSARALMAVVAAWRNDISATNTTTGTATAYALATSEGINTTPANGQMISFIAHANSGAAPTLQVDGGNTYPLWLTGTTIPAGTLVAGSPYRVAFSVSNSAWLLEAGYGNTGTPLGGILWSTSPTAPSSNFVAPSGQCISTTTYAAYWVQQGSPASGGCPGGQFAIIDMRGRVAAALDTLNASAANRLTNSATGCGVAFTSIGAVCTENQSTTLVTINLPPYTPAGAITVTSTTSDFMRSTTGLTDNYASIGGACCFINQARNAVTSTGALAGTAQGGTSTPFSKVQPTIGLIPYLRIL
jgi:hypothetical protein